MSNIEEDIMSEEAFNELIDNFEIVGTLTKYGRKAIKQNVKNLQKRIKELEEYICIAPNLDEMSATKYLNIQREAYVRGRAEEQQKAEEINKEYEDSKDENGNSEYYYPDYTIRKLEELLEEK